MSVEKHTLYLKGEQCVEVKKRDVTLGDLAAMECTNSQVLPRLKSMKIMKMPDTGKHRFVISILKLIECIHKEFPNMEIQSMGAADVIVTYEASQKKNALWSGIKVGLVSAVTFIGAAFAIMTFNNDSGTTELFGKIYEQFMGKEKTGFTILELTYSLGLVIGILVFFNHFGRKRFTADPTPIEVEMRLYENDIQNTVIADYARKGQELDVDKTSVPGNHRS